MTGADRLLEALAGAGVERLFGNPGSTELPLVDALGRQQRVRYVLGLTEAVVMGMADGYAQAGRRLGVVNVHVQPGMANALSGVLNAARARVPLLVTVGQQVRELLPTAPFLGGDVVSMAASVAKAAWEVHDPAALSPMLGRAVTTALTPPAGPVVLSIPLDVQAAASGPLAPSPSPPPPPPPPRDLLERAAAVLAGASRPVVLLGDGVGHAGAGASAAALCARVGAPAYGEPMAALVPLPTDHPLWRGPMPPFAAQIRPVLEPHDVVLAVGMPVFRLFGWSPGPALPGHVRLVHVDVDPAEVGRVHPPEVGIAADPGAVLAGLLALLGDPAPADEARRRGEEARTAALRHRARRDLAAADTGPRVGPATLARALAQAIRPRDLVVDEGLTSTRGLRTALGRRVPGTWLAHRGSALGWGLPAAVGAAIAGPGRRVMALQGDGSAVFGLPALWTAAAEGAGVALVVADNGGYEILRAGMEGLTGRPQGAWPGLALRAPRLDIASLAGGFGAVAARVDAAADLPAALQDLWRSAREGPAVLVVAVEGRTPPVGYPLG